MLALGRVDSVFRQKAIWSTPEHDPSKRLMVRILVLGVLVVYGVLYMWGLLGPEALSRGLNRMLMSIPCCTK